MNSEPKIGDLVICDKRYYEGFRKIWMGLVAQIHEELNEVVVYWFLKPPGSTVKTLSAYSIFSIRAWAKEAAANAVQYKEQEINPGILVRYESCDGKVHLGLIWKHVAEMYFIRWFETGFIGRFYEHEIFSDARIVSVIG